MWEIQRYAAWRVPRRVNDLGLKRSPAKNVTLLQQLIHVGKLRRVYAEEGGLHVHRLIEGQVVAVHEHGSARVLMKFAQAADVVDVRVRADDDFYDELMAPDQVQDARDFVAWVHHQRFARGGIADDGAVALQHPNGDSDVDQSVIGGIKDRSTVAHEGDYIIGDEAVCLTRSLPRSLLCVLRDLCVEHPHANPKNLRLIHGTPHEIALS